MHAIQTVRKQLSALVLPPFWQGIYSRGKNLLSSRANSFHLMLTHLPKGLGKQTENHKSWLSWKNYQPQRSSLERYPETYCTPIESRPGRKLIVRLNTPLPLFVRSWSIRHVTKTFLFKYTENFTTRKWKFSDKKILIFFIFLLNT